MEAAIAWIATHWMELLGVLFLVDKLAAAVVALTPTPVDDRWYGRFYRWIVEPAAGIWGRRAKELPGEREIKQLAKDAGAHTAARKAGTLKKAADRAENLIRAKLGLVLLLGLAVTVAALPGCTGALIVQTNEADDPAGGGQRNAVTIRPHQPLDVDAAGAEVSPAVGLPGEDTPTGRDVGPSGQDAPDGEDGSTAAPDAPGGETGDAPPDETADEPGEPPS